MNYKKILLPTLLFIGFATIALAQKMVPKNLVPNPSFEFLIDLPLRPNLNNYFECEPLSGYIPFQRNLGFWKTANKNTPDLRVVEGKSFSACRNRYDYCVRPKRGRVMVGIITYMSNYTSDTYREYIQVKLKGVVKPGIKTFVELWICKDRKAKLVSNNIGFHFSQRPFNKDTHGNVKVKPQVNWTKVVNEEEQKWEKVSGYFYPDKPYIYLTIGNFGTNDSTIYKESEQHSGHARLQPYASYLIDEVRVWQEGDTLEEEVIYELAKTKKVEPEPVVLKNINFETNSAKLLNSSFDELNKLLAYMQEHPQIKIAIHGHTDNEGEHIDNIELSNARAKAVLAFLTAKGVADERLEFRGFGEEKPIASNDTNEGRLTNRRVEFVVLE